MVEWARALATVPFCYVIEISGGSVITACRGRWATSDTFSTIQYPEESDCCGYCWNVSLGRPGYTPPEPTVIVDGKAFDLSDVEQYHEQITVDLT